MTKLKETISNINQILAAGWEAEVSGNRDIYKVNISTALFLVQAIAVDHQIEPMNIEYSLSPDDFEDSELLNKLMMETFYCVNLLMTHDDEKTIKQVMISLSLLKDLLYGNPVSSGPVDQGRCITSIVCK